MPHQHTDETSFRLRRLPGQLLLALLNGTAILVIAAALLALAATAKVTHLAENVAATMTDAVLSRVDVKPGRVIAKIDNLTTEIRSLRDALQQEKVERRADLDPAVRQLKEKLARLEKAIENLSDARSRLVNEAAAQLSLSLGEVLQDFGSCKLDAARS
jgi:flagellar motility protein MotE (MotC chaperone)